MRLQFFLLLLAFNIVHGQTDNKYIAVYSKTIQTTLAPNPKNVRINVGDNPMARELADQTLSNLTNTPLQLRFQDSLIASSDSVIAYQLPCEIQIWAWLFG